MKKLLCASLTAVMLLSLAACAPAAKDDIYEIGICQIQPHPALDAATKGFQDAVTERLGADKVKFDFQNAAGDTNTCNTIINSFVSKNVDLILANATPALQSAVAGTSVIPILGTAVTEYGVALALKDFNGVVGGNVSGTSDLAPLDKQAEMIRTWFPDARKAGLLYCSSEPNSVYQIDVVEAELTEMGYECQRYTFSDGNDLAAVTQQAAEDSDVIYVPTDNTVAVYTGTIDNICRPAGVPVIAGEEGICSGCGVATLSISYYDLGYATGEMAAKILAEGADISTMPIGYAEKQTPKYNPEICKALNLTPPDGYAAIGE